MTHGNSPAPTDRARLEACLDEIRRLRAPLTKTLEIYNHEERIAPGRWRLAGNGWLVRVVSNGHTRFVRFGPDEAAARAYLAEAS